MRASKVLEVTYALSINKYWHIVNILDPASPRILYSEIVKDALPKIPQKKHFLAQREYMKQLLKKMVDFINRKRFGSHKSPPRVHEKVPKEHDPKTQVHQNKDGFPRRIWPTDQEKHKGPKF